METGDHHRDSNLRGCRSKQGHRIRAKPVSEVTELRSFPPSKSTPTLNFLLHHQVEETVLFVADQVAEIFIYQAH